MSHVYIFKIYQLHKFEFFEALFFSLDFNIKYIEFYIILLYNTTNISYFLYKYKWHEKENSCYI